MVVANETKNTQTGTVVQSVVGCSMRVLVLISIALLALIAAMLMAGT
jgi:hypothetical protein